jgi:hypothetical protein
MATAFFVALTAISAIGKMNAANSQAQAEVDQANRQEKVSMLNTEQKAGAAKASFLSSGLTMAGTPELAVKNIFTTGITDVNNIGANANTAAKNAIASGRAAAIGQIAGSAAMASAGGSMGSMFDTAGSYMPDSFAYGLNKMGFGNDAYNMLEQSDARNL